MWRNIARDRFGSGMLGWAMVQPGGSFELRINGWTGYEMVKTFNRPLSQQQHPNRIEPIRKPGLDLLEEDEIKTKRPSMWNIVFYNDDYTSMKFVQFVLMKVLHRSTEDALALTLTVHTQGKGIAGTYTFEVAEQKQCEVLLMENRGTSVTGRSRTGVDDRAGNPSRQDAG